jgi:hypothetical protein
LNFHESVEVIGKAIDVAGVTVIAAGIAYVTFSFLRPRGYDLSTESTGRIAADGKRAAAMVPELLSLAHLQGFQRRERHRRSTVQWHRSRLTVRPAAHRRRTARRQGDPREVP